MPTWARWLLAVVAAFILLGLAVIFNMGGLLVLAFSTDGCRSLPKWSGYYILIPPVVMGLGALIAPLLFALKTKWYWWVGTLVGSVVLGGAAYVGGIVIIISICG